jgi:hypothetical protein
LTRKLLPCLGLLFLTACASNPPPPPEPVVVTQEVKVPVPVPCLKQGDLPPPPGTSGTPAYPDLNLRSSDPLDVKARAFAVGRELRDKRIATLEGLLAGCVAPAPTS